MSSLQELKQREKELLEQAAAIQAELENVRYEIAATEVKAAAISRKRERGSSPPQNLSLLHECSDWWPASLVLPLSQLPHGTKRPVDLMMWFASPPHSVLMKNFSEDKILWLGPEAKPRIPGNKETNPPTPPVPSTIAQVINRYACIEEGFEVEIRSTTKNANAQREYYSLRCRRHVHYEAARRLPTHITINKRKKSNDTFDVRAMNKHLFAGQHVTLYTGAKCWEQAVAARDAGVSRLEQTLKLGQPKPDDMDEETIELAKEEAKELAARAAEQWGEENAQALAAAEAAAVDNEVVRPVNHAPSQKAPRCREDKCSFAFPVYYDKTVGLFFVKRNCNASFGHVHRQPGAGRTTVRKRKVDADDDLDAGFNDSKPASVM